MAESLFNADYYDRYYTEPETRVGSSESTARLGRFICAYLAYLELDVRTVLDFGCGLGWWRAPVEAAFPGVDYRGVEFSQHLCEKHGWTQGSVVDYSHAGRADLVICQGVLQYLDDDRARAAITNLAMHTGTALYLEALTKTDWREVCDRQRTDGEVYLRSGAWYRRALTPHFRSCGGGLFLPHRSPAGLFELERGWF